MKSSLIHLISGSTGAGKTTYAMALADKIGGIRFSIDEWMVNLYAPDMPQPIDPAWIFERVSRCEKQISILALQAVERGIPAILDLSFQRMEHRKATAEHFREKGFDVQLHWMDVSVEERWKRVEARNNQQGATYKLTVTRQMFDFMEHRWEAPRLEEAAAFNGIRVD